MAIAMGNPPVSISEEAMTTDTTHTPTDRRQVGYWNSPPPGMRQPATPPEPPKPRARRHLLRWILLRWIFGSVVGFFVLIVILGIALHGHQA
jgi:hypothetical protein